MSMGSPAARSIYSHTVQIGLLLQPSSNRVVSKHSSWLL